MSILGLTYFLTAAEELNFSRAAEKLYISQQTLSGHIQRLEEHYGVELFRRKPTLRLTPAGETMLFYARQMLGAEHRMTAQFADIVSQCRGHLRLGMSRQRTQALFCGIWSRFHAENPNISVYLKDANTEVLLEQLRGDALDLVIGVDVHPTRDLIVAPLAAEPLYCTVNSALLQQYRPDNWHSLLAEYEAVGVDLLSLHDLPFLMPPVENRLRAVTEQLFASRGVHPRVALETNNQSLMMDLADSGIGILSALFLYEVLQGRHLLPEGTRAFPVRNEVSSAAVSLVCRAGVTQPNYVERMKDAIYREFTAYQEVIKLRQL